MAARPRYDLTEENHTAIVKTIAATLSIKAAARFSGIPERTVARWRARGRDYEIHLESEGGRKAAEEKYLRFWTETEAARVSLMRRAGVVLSESMLQADDPKLRLDAAKFVLKHSAPELWNRTVVVGSVGEVEPEEIDEEKERREALALLDEVAKRRERRKTG